MNTIWTRISGLVTGNSGTPPPAEKKQPSGQFAQKKVEQSDEKTSSGSLLSGASSWDSDNDSGISSGASSKQTTPETETASGFVDLGKDSSFTRVSKSLSFRRSAYGHAAYSLAKLMSEEKGMDTSAKIKEAMTELYIAAMGPPYSDNKKICLQCIDLIKTIQGRQGLPPSQQKTAIDTIVKQLFSIHDPDRFNVIALLQDMTEEQGLYPTEQSLGRLLAIKTTLETESAVEAYPHAVIPRRQEMQKVELLRCVDTMNAVLKKMDIKGYAPSSDANYSNFIMKVIDTHKEKYKQKGTPKAEGDIRVNLEQYAPLIQDLERIEIKIDVANGPSFDNKTCLKKQQSMEEKERAIYEFVDKLAKALTQLPSHVSEEVVACLNQTPLSALRKQRDLELQDVLGPVGQVLTEHNKTGGRIVCHIDPKESYARLQLRVITADPIVKLNRGNYRKKGESVQQFTGNSRFVAHNEIELYTGGMRRLVLPPTYDILLQDPVAKQ